MARKPFDHTLGKHVTSVPAPDVDIFDVTPAAVLAEVCDVCDAQPGKESHSIMGSHPKRTYPHRARLLAARARAARNGQGDF